MHALAAVDDREVLGEPLAALRGLILGYQGTSGRSSARISRSDRQALPLAPNCELLLSELLGLTSLPHPLLADGLSVLLSRALSFVRALSVRLAFRRREGMGGQFSKFVVNLMRGTAEYFQVTCLCVFAHVCQQMYVCSRVRVCVYVYVHNRVYVCARLCVRVSACVCIFAYIHVCKHKCVCVSTCIHNCVSIHLC